MSDDPNWHYQKIRGQNDQHYEGSDLLWLAVQVEVRPDNKLWYPLCEDNQYLDPKVEIVLDWVFACVSFVAAVGRLLAAVLEVVAEAPAAAEDTFLHCLVETIDLVVY